MKPIILLCLIPLANSCFVLQPTCDCQVMAITRANIDWWVQWDNTLRPSLENRQLSSPKITRSQCNVTVQCDEGYSLVVFNQQDGKNYENRTIHGTCARGAKSWQVTDGTSSKPEEVDTLYATCVDFRETLLCSPEDSTTFLFAYSNDLNASIFPNMLSQFKNGSAYPTANFATFAHVRFDMRVEEKISYFGDLESWLDSLSSNRPDPNLKFTDPQSGSDILKVIEKFLNNTDYPICGSRIVVLMKRYPTEPEAEKLIEKLRKNHVTVFIEAVGTMLSGSSSETMQTIVTRTNGYSTVADETDQDYQGSYAAGAKFEFTTYEMKISYRYSKAEPEQMRIRVYALINPVNYWVPYDN
ncbi:hypothetical protein CAEBREN_14213 [Caenorhabditis brenneri]|uniref:Uncharacterized protein n=1 Tax=Caenorhabditis brenneri TaxID=135651 RepID=G0N2L2_CAEBE|nr:hypothetical protein CAEBREN_14213 [Caenorhabditis brenneri]